MDKKSMQEMIDEARAKREPGGVIVAVDETHYQINEHPYELMVNYRDAFDRSELSDRFNTYFSRYDYLVGDWGFGQLRLRGFYDDKRNVAGELKIGALEDYLTEACNTGCPYFVMHNEEAKVVTPKRNNRQRENTHRGRTQNNQHSNSSRPQSNKHQSGQNSGRNQNSNSRSQNNSTRSRNSNTRQQNNNHNRSHNNNAANHSQNRSSQSSRRLTKPTSGQQKAYTVEKVKPVKSTPVSKRQGTVKTVGHSQHRKFTIREKED